MDDDKERERWTAEQEPPKDLMEFGCSSSSSSSSSSSCSSSKWHGGTREKGEKGGVEWHVSTVSRQ